MKWQLVSAAILRAIQQQAHVSCTLFNSLVKKGQAAAIYYVSMII